MVYKNSVKKMFFFLEKNNKINNVCMYALAYFRCNSLCWLKYRWIKFSNSCIMLKKQKIVSKCKYIEYIYYTDSVFHIEINHFMIHIQISNEIMYSIQNILSFAYREIFPSFCTI